MLSDALPLTTCDLPTPDWGRLGEQLPVEWILGALNYTGKASIRQRRLPAEQVVWLVIALAIYRHRSVRQVLGELELALPDLKDTCVTDSAVTQARQRLGEEPLAWLFQRPRAIGKCKMPIARTSTASSFLLWMGRP